MPKCETIRKEYADGLVKYTRYKNGKPPLPDIDPNDEKTWANILRAEWQDNPFAGFIAEFSRPEVRLVLTPFLRSIEMILDELDEEQHKLAMVIAQKPLLSEKARTVARLRDWALFQKELIERYPLISLWIDAKQQMPKALYSGTYRLAKREEETNRED